MELNERIAAVRKAAGLTQEQLGELVNVSRQAVSKWESGQAVPDALTIAELCRKLHVSADYLLLGTDPENTPENAAPAYDLPDTCPCCGRSVDLRSAGCRTRAFLRHRGAGRWGSRSSDYSRSN